MKRTHCVAVFFILLSAFFTSVQEAKAQCQDAAGANTVICLHWYNDSTYLGNPVAPTWGIAPYSYSWSCLEIIGSKYYTTSSFLEDTAIAYPRILDAYPDPLTFVLTISDSAGNYCMDTVVVKGSSYFWTADVKKRTINQGQSVRLNTSIGGGIKPLTYSWLPTSGLTDPTDANTMASPIVSTMYLLEVTDSAGCMIMDGFEIVVKPTSINETESRVFSISPNPMMEKTRIEHIGDHGDSCILVLYNSLGKIVREVELKEAGGLTFYRENLSSGLYYYRIMENRVPIQKGRLQLY